MIELLIFAVSTLIFFVLRFLVPSYNRVFTFLYYVIVVGGQLYFNMKLHKSICGDSNYTGPILNTFIPWMLIFGVLQAMLIIFPGWKQPFSNTFGYFVTRLAGINELLFSILKSPKGDTTQLEKTLHNIYGNPSLFINEITPMNFDEYVQRSQFMFKPGMKNSKEMDKFRSMIQAKEIVSEFVWYMLSGLLVTTVSYNAIASSNCSQSLKEMKKRHAEYEQDVKKYKEEQENAPPERIYNIRD